MKYYFIVNGRADKSEMHEEIHRQIDECAPLFEAKGIVTDLYMTTGEGDATRQVRLYCDLHPDEKVCFVACGGDGTLNEVASGLVGFAHKSVALLNFCGHGDDFVKYYPDRKFQSLKDILDGETVRIDIMKVNDSYCINVCDFGVDAIAASAANMLSQEGKTNVYRKGVLRALLVGRYNHIVVKVDGEKLGGRYMLSCSLGNGKYMGGEFLCCPFAANDDGLIEVSFFKAMSLLRFILTLSPYVKGKHFETWYTKGKCIYRQGKHIEIYSKRMIELCLDGELLPGTHFNIDIFNKAIVLHLPKKQSVTINP